MLVRRRGARKKDGTHCLYDESLHPADGSPVALEALALPGGVVALASSSALVRGEVRHLDLGHVGGRAVEHVVHVDAGQLRGAAVGAFVVHHLDDVLGTLVVAAGESHIQMHVITGRIQGTSHSDAVDNLIGEVQKSELDIVNEVVEFQRCATHGDGDGSVHFVHSRCELQSKGLSFVLAVVDGALKHQLLSLILQRHQKVVSGVQRIGSIATHAFGAVNISVSGVAYAASGFAAVPIVVT